MKLSEASAEDEYMGSLDNAGEAYLVALETLDDTDREVIHATVFERVSISELARRLGVSRRTAYRRIETAKQNLIEKANNVVELHK
jgi:DNA-directed RNA polymerase specialized sigma24 family protein